MTRDEAEAVARICITADGGCYVCAGDLIGQLKERFPDCSGWFQGVYDEEWGDD